MLPSPGCQRTLSIEDPRDVPCPSASEQEPEARHTLREDELIVQELYTSPIVTLDGRSRPTLRRVLC